MEKIPPRAVPFEVRPARTVEISLARNEKESFQVAVMGAEGPLRQVAVSVSDLTCSWNTPPLRADC